MADLDDWCSSILPGLQARVRADPFWSRGFGARIHLAVFQEPFLTWMLDGTKTVESRFATRRSAPYGLVEPGETILIKASSGPVVGLARVARTLYLELDDDRLEAIRREFGAAIRAEIAGFWEERREARFASLFAIEHPCRLDPPLPCPKRDRRGWVVLRPEHPVQQRGP